MRGAINKLREKIIKWLGYEVELDKVYDYSASLYQKVADREKVNGDKLAKLKREIRELKKLNIDMYRIVNECREDSRTIKEVSKGIEHWWSYDKLDFLNKVEGYINGKRKREEIL